jgi:hypothetical protein
MEGCPVTTVVGFLRPFRNAVLALTLLAAVSGCQGTGDPADDDVGAGTLSAMAGHLTLLNQELLPASLDVDGTAAAALQGGLRSALEAVNPCEGYDPFNCQPVLLRYYLAATRVLVASMFVTLLAEVVDRIIEHETDFADGSTGAITVGNRTIAWSRASASNYSLLVKDGGQPVFHVAVEDWTTTIRADLDLLLEGGPGGRMEIAFRFVDLHTWNIEATIVGQPCRPDDVRAPRNFRLAIRREAGLWKGKALTYHPFFAEAAPTCDTLETADTSMNLYTDFVGDHAAAKANIYFLRRDKDALDDISGYGMDALCVNHPEILGGNACSGAGGQVFPSSYTNPFCNPAATDIAHWGDSCQRISAGVADGTFGPATDWTLPSDFHRMAITLPASL